MALRRGFGGSGTITKGSGLDSGPKTFWLPPGTQTVVTLLDDLPVEVVRHQQYLKGDKKGNAMRVTCAGLDPATSPDPVPRECLVCNAALRYDRIVRKHFLYLTIIDEREFDFEGRRYKDMKRLLELTPDAAELFERRRKAQGGLVGSRWQVYRSKGQRAARHGDDWQFLGYCMDGTPYANEPIERRMMRHFWSSPAIPNIITAHGRQRGPDGKPLPPLDRAAACRQLVTPYNYEELMGTYDPKLAAAFVAYHEAAVGGGSPSFTADAPSTAGGGDFSGFPDQPTGPSYPAPATMPTDAAPATPAAPAPAPAQPTAPPANSQPPWETQQPAGGQMPAVPDPQSAGAAPPFPDGEAAPAAQPTAPSAAQPAAPQPAGAMPGAGFQFGPPSEQQPVTPQAPLQTTQPNGFPEEPF